MTRGPIVAGVPLVRPGSTADPIGYVDGRTVTVAEFLADAAALAARLPERSHVLNLCTDRYRFTVGFAAALIRGQASLLPPQRTADFLARLARGYAGLYALTEVSEPDLPMEALVYPSPIAANRVTATIPAFPPQQVAAIVFTSGTTGEPIPHVKTWGALARGAMGEAQALGLDHLPRATVVGTVPPQHMYGIESTVMIVLQARLAMSNGRPFYPEDVRAALAGVPAPRVLVTTPVHLRALDIEGIQLPPLALVLSATAPLAEEVAARAEARFGAPVHEIYGFTEVGMVASRRTVEGPAWRPPPGVRLRREGEAWWAEGAHIDVPARFTDLIEVFEDGRFALFGRATDMVNVAGKRTSLASLNFHLLSIPGVRDGAYYLPPESGETVARLAAFVVAPGVSTRVLREELRRRVDPIFLPRPLHFVAALPRNATGKLPAEALGRLAAECAKRR